MNSEFEEEIQNDEEIMDEIDSPTHAIFVVTEDEMRRIQKVKVVSTLSFEDEPRKEGEK